MDRGEGGGEVIGGPSRPLDGGIDPTMFVRLK